MPHPTPAPAGGSPESRYERPLAALLREWKKEGASDLYPGAATCEVTTDLGGAGTEAVELGSAATEELRRLIIQDLFRRDNVAKTRERDAKMVGILVAAVEAGEDGGDLFAAAVHAAAQVLYRHWYLVIGRPGSWEASIIEQMAVYGRHTHQSEHLAPLASLIADIGRRRDQGFPEDGGETLSQVLGEAVNRLGSIARLAGLGQWAADVDNLAWKYATEEVRASSQYFS